MVLEVIRRLHPGGATLARSPERVATGPSLAVKVDWTWWSGGCGPDIRGLTARLPVQRVDAVRCRRPT